MKKLAFLLPLIVVSCGSQLVDFPEGSAWAPCNCNDAGPGPTITPPPVDPGPTTTVDQDSGTVEQDAGTADPDAGTIEEDSSVVLPDSGIVEKDACSVDQDTGTKDSGVVVQDSGTVEQDSGIVTDSGDGQDSGTITDSGNGGDDVCRDGVSRTCEDQLHCCMDTCKLLVHNSSAQHVSCVQACADDHKKCVEDRRPKSCYKNNGKH